LPTSSEPTGPLAIRAEGLGKQYRIAGRLRREETLRDVLASSVGSAIRRDGKSRPNRETFWALKDISFDVRQGENVGILGLNGAGKSTLLKILSRVTAPTTGQAQIHGRLGSLLEVGTGFHGELTGRENIFLYGAILGMTHAEISRKFSAIVAFSGIEEFINMPVKRYSSGMYVRLAFSVAAHLEPDILLLDEVLAVGDLPFQRKCMDLAKDMQNRRATILFVSHNMFSIKSMCDRVIYIQAGKIRFDGPATEGIDLYEADCQLGPVPWAKAEVGDAPIGITGVTVADEAGVPRSVFDHGERMRLRFEFKLARPVEAPNFVVAFVRSDGVACCCYSTELDGVSIDVSPGEGMVELLTPPLLLVAELYTIEILVRESGFQKLICAQLGATFHVRHPLLDINFGVFHEAGEWLGQDEPCPATRRTPAMEAAP
jgi:lipopolysaccharide transport system ATP-binding protein